MFFRSHKNTNVASNKYSAEVIFWANTLQQYIAWYNGDLKILYGEESPNQKSKITGINIKDCAILTWEKVHQQRKYLEDLQLSASAFKGLKLLDIGSGPHPSARVFKSKELYCLDPLLSEYITAGFPLHYYGNVKFVAASAEAIPLEDNSVDAIISVNALDHVDNFEKTAEEIGRVLRKKHGKVRFHLHYHRATTEEPIELTDERVKTAYSWLKGFAKLSESKRKRGTTLENADEKYVVWSNFSQAP